MQWHGVGQTIPYTKVHASTHMISKEKVHYQHHQTCQTWATKADCTLTLCGRDGEVWENNLRERLALKSDTQRGQKQDMEKWYRNRDKEIEENKIKPKPQRLFFCDSNLKWSICSCSAWSLPSFTLLPSHMLLRALTFMVRRMQRTGQRLLVLVHHLQQCDPTLWPTINKK